MNYIDVQNRPQQRSSDPGLSLRPATPGPDLLRRWFSSVDTRRGQFLTPRGEVMIGTQEQVEFFSYYSPWQRRFENIQQLIKQGVLPDDNDATITPSETNLTEAMISLEYDVWKMRKYTPPGPECGRTITNNQAQSLASFASLGYTFSKNWASRVKQVCPKQLVKCLSLPDVTEQLQLHIDVVNRYHGTTDPDIILSILYANQKLGGIYMCPTLLPTHSLYSPYAMKLTPLEGLDQQNYCSVGRNHVFRYIKGKQSRKMSVKRWYFEQDVITKLRQILFFKQFKMRKAFLSLAGECHDMSRFGVYRRKIRSHLFFCNKDWALSLLIIRGMILEMTSLKLLHLDPDLTYTLHEFLNTQVHHIHNTCQKLMRIHGVITRMTSYHCWDDVISADLAKATDRNGHTSKRMAEWRKSKRIRQRFSDIDVMRGEWNEWEDAAVCKEKEEEKIKRCERLRRFIYLVDCLQKDALHQILSETLETMIYWLKLNIKTFPRESYTRELVRKCTSDFNIFEDDFDPDDSGDDDDPSGGRPGKPLAKPRESGSNNGGQGPSGGTSKNWKNPDSRHYNPSNSTNLSGYSEFGSQVPDYCMDVADVEMTDPRSSTPSAGTSESEYTTATSSLDDDMYSFFDPPEDFNLFPELRTFFFDLPPMPDLFEPAAAETPTETEAIVSDPTSSAGDLSLNHTTPSKNISDLSVTKLGNEVNVSMIDVNVEISETSNLTITSDMGCMNSKDGSMDNLPSHSRIFSADSHGKMSPSVNVQQTSGKSSKKTNQFKKKYHLSGFNKTIPSKSDIGCIMKNSDMEIKQLRKVNSENQSKSTKPGNLTKKSINDLSNDKYLNQTLSNRAGHDKDVDTLATNLSGIFDSFMDKVLISEKTNNTGIDNFLNVEVVNAYKWRSKTAENCLKVMTSSLGTSGNIRKSDSFQTKVINCKAIGRNENSGGIILESKSTELELEEDYSNLKLSESTDVVSIESSTAVKNKNNCVVIVPEIPENEENTPTCSQRISCPINIINSETELLVTKLKHIRHFRGDSKDVSNSDSDVSPLEEESFEMKLVSGNIFEVNDSYCSRLSMRRKPLEEHQKSYHKTSRNGKYISLSSFSSQEYNNSVPFLLMESSFEQPDKVASLKIVKRMVREDLNHRVPPSDYKTPPNRVEFHEAAGARNVEQVMNVPFQQFQRLFAEKEPVRRLSDSVISIKCKNLFCPKASFASIATEVWKNNLADILAGSGAESGTITSIHSKSTITSHQHTASVMSPADSQESRWTKILASAGGNGSPGDSFLLASPLLKPIFHLVLQIDERINQTIYVPNIYEFSASTFHLLVDIEEQLLSVAKVSQKPTFEAFDPIKGTGLDRAIRNDSKLYRNKAEIYRLNEEMFKHADVYREEMELISIRMFSYSPGVNSHKGKPVGHFCKRLRRHTKQRRIIDRIPDSQRLGIFLIHVTPFRESLKRRTEKEVLNTQTFLKNELSCRTTAIKTILERLLSVLKYRPTRTDWIFRVLTAADATPDVIARIQNDHIEQVSAFYDLIDSYDIAYQDLDRYQTLDYCHHLLACVKFAAEQVNKDRVNLVNQLKTCIVRDVEWIEHEAESTLTISVNHDIFLDGSSDGELVNQALVETENLVTGLVTKAKFVRQVQVYVDSEESDFNSLYNTASRHVNTRNLWLLMADWDNKVEMWKNQDFTTLNVHEIKNYTFLYMEACNKLAKVLPKNSVVQVFERKMDVMLRWLNFIIECSGKQIRPRHWTQIEGILGVQFSAEFPHTLDSLMKAKAINFQQQLNAVLNKAKLEGNIELEYLQAKETVSKVKMPIHSATKVLIEGRSATPILTVGDTFECEENLNFCVMEMERLQQSPHSQFLNADMEDLMRRCFEAIEFVVNLSEIQLKLTRLRRMVLHHADISQRSPQLTSQYEIFYKDFSTFLRPLKFENVMVWSDDRVKRGRIESMLRESNVIYHNIRHDMERAAQIAAGTYSTPV